MMIKILFFASLLLNLLIFVYGIINFLEVKNND